MVSFIITKSAGTYLSPLGKTTGDFYQIFKNALFDYNDVSDILVNAKAKSKFTHGRIPNWKMTMNKIIDDTEVWLITEDDIGTSIPVRNRFTRKGEWLTIPKDLGNGPVNKKDQDWLIRKIKEYLEDRDHLKKQPNEQGSKFFERELSKLYMKLWGENERTLTDWMGCYIPRTGTILIKIDRVDRAADLFGCPPDLLFQKVLLHEFIHAALDLWPRDAAGNISYHKAEWEWQDIDKEFFNEESIDNAIVLTLYNGTSGYCDVKGFIETQPYYYRRAVKLYESGKLLLDQLIEELITYKITAPVSTTPVSTAPVSTTPSTATSGKYTYYVNGKQIVPVGKMGAGIGAAAYEVFSIIIPTLSLFDVLNLKKYGSIKLVGLPLVIDANSYKKSPNQTKYYKVPISTKDRQDIYLCSQWYDNPANRNRHFNLLKTVVSAYPGLFPGGVYRLP